MVRLAPGVSREAAIADLNVLFQQYMAGDKTLSDRARAQGFKSLDLAPASAGLPEFRDRYGKPVQAMLAIVSVLLLLACANLASLFLARAAARQRDLSVCLALGARRTRLARQLLSETLLISIAGGALGLLVAWWGVDLLVGFLPEFGPPADLQFRPDGNVLLFTLAASMLTGLSIGLAPAWLAGKVGYPRHAVRPADEPSRLAPARSRPSSSCRSRCRRVLVVAATLFTGEPDQSESAAAGVRCRRRADADGRRGRIPASRASAWQRAHREILQRLQALPGVQRRDIRDDSAAQLQRGWQAHLDSRRHVLVS